MSKINCPDFLSYISKFDIIGLQEIKTDLTDEIYVPGYETFMFCRKKLSNYRSGGIALLIRSSIAPYVLVEKSDECKLIHFFTISKDLYGSTSYNEDLKCGIVYIPPLGSKYSYSEPFFEIQNELFRYFSQSKHCILFGDLNARCGNLQDYTVMSELLTEFCDLQTFQTEEGEIFRNFALYNIPLDRNTADNSCNNYGLQLIDLCKNNNIFMWNGRMFSEQESPQLTCKNASTVDYFLSSSFVFENIVDFKVEEFSSLYSDVHCPVYAVLKSKKSPTENQPETVLDAASKTIRWDQSKADFFSENLDLIKIANIEVKLDQLNDRNGITQDDMNDVVNNIASLFEECSKDTFGSQEMNARKNNPRKSNFPWFTRDCKQMRDVYHKTRKAYNKYKTQYFKDLLKTVSRQYKSTLRQASNRYNTIQTDKIRKLKHADPKKFWNLLKDKNKLSEPTASLDAFYDFFKNLNETSCSENSNTEDETLEINPTNEYINGPITEEEIQQCIKVLKNNKAPGYDNIVNEQIKYTAPMMINIYKKLFNIVFETGIIPESWTIGLIKPIYKNKGDPNLPENYRPISLLSCLGKLFTCILNKRLNTFAEKSNLINETQAGFRKAYSTIDNIFILNCLIDIVKSKKKKLYCCFVDFKQAFDSIWRVGLWQKLRRENINGKCFRVIQNLYNHIKSKVITSDGSTEFFDCMKGVRQGENLSPFLFSIFLNDLYDFLQNNIHGITNETVIEGAQIYLKLFILLYADDTVIFSDSEKDLQNALAHFKRYCDQWKLDINVNKTKILIFSNGRYNCKQIFKLGEKELDIVTEYKYLGLLFTKSGSYYKTKTNIAEQARKAMFALLRKIKALSLPFDIQIEMFDKIIKPILLYGSEVWGFGNIDMLEKVQLQFYKYIFNLKKSTPSYMIYGETGTLPLSVNIKNRLISFWARIIQNTIEDATLKLSTKIYLIIYDLYLNNQIKSKWLDSIRHYLCTSGYSGIWYCQSFNNPKWLIKSSFQKLKDMFIQSWQADINQTSSTNLYKYTKNHFTRAYYLDKLPGNLCKNLIRFFTRNHRLPIEIGRWQNTPIHERKCTHCNDLGDEFHYLFVCPIFDYVREQYIDSYTRIRPNMQKFVDLINTDNVIKLKKLSIFCGKIMQNFT